MAKKFHYEGVEREALRAYFQMLERVVDEFNVALPLPIDAKVENPEISPRGDGTSDVHSNIIFYWSKKYSNFRVRIHVHGKSALVAERNRYGDWQVRYIKVYDDSEMKNVVASYMACYHPNGKLEISPLHYGKVPQDPVPKSNRLLEWLRRL